MATSQIWKINGKTYTREQLAKLRSQRIKPQEAEVSFTQKAVIPIPSPKEISFFELKKLAKEKGMEVTNKTTKNEISNFLNK